MTIRFIPDKGSGITDSCFGLRMVILDLKFARADVSKNGGKNSALDRSVVAARHFRYLYFSVSDLVRISSAPRIDSSQRKPLTAGRYAYRGPNGNGPAAHALGSCTPLMALPPRSLA
jgi:hypothetical protein